RWHRAGTFLTFVDPGRTDGDGIVVLVPDLVAQDIAPEPGETAGIGTVDHELGEFAGHVRISPQQRVGRTPHTTRCATAEWFSPMVRCQDSHADTATSESTHHRHWNRREDDGLPGRTHRRCASRFSTHSPPGKRESTTTESHRSPTHP